MQVIDGLIYNEIDYTIYLKHNDFICWIPSSVEEDLVDMNWYDFYSYQDFIHAYGETELKLVFIKGDNDTIHEYEFKP